MWFWRLAVSFLVSTFTLDELATTIPIAKCFGREDEPSGRTVQIIRIPLVGDVCLAVVAPSLLALKRPNFPGRGEFLSSIFRKVSR